MSGGAAGGFLTRAFESMLKECSTKKYPALQTAIQNYLDSAKEVNQQSVSGEANQVSTLAGEQSLPETDADEPEQISKPLGARGTITTALANAGHTLEGAEADLVLNPLRLAFETKNMKVIELALDCLHKLIAYDHLEGDPGLDDGSLFTDILSMVCSCVDNSSSDSTILQVLKVLLTAVASTKFRGMLQWLEQ
ncbi:hypothetical protein CsSME_00008961 [Camellia sinensis var. sinensis]